MSIDALVLGTLPTQRTSKNGNDQGDRRMTPGGLAHRLTTWTTFSDGPARPQDRATSGDPLRLGHPLNKRRKPSLRPF